MATDHSFPGRDHSVIANAFPIHPDRVADVGIRGMRS